MNVADGYPGSHQRALERDRRQPKAAYAAD
jgi:hypothetical protein